MPFEDDIKKWVGLDNQLKILNEKAKNIRSEKNELNETIMDYVETNSLNNATVKISDGRLRFGQTKQTCPLTLKLIEQCLADCISNEEQVEFIMNHIKEKRDIKVVQDIKRYYAKNE